MAERLESLIVDACDFTQKPVQIPVYDAWVIKLHATCRNGRGRYERPMHSNYTNSVWRAGLYTEKEAKDTQRAYPEKYEAIPFEAELRRELTRYGDPSKFNTEQRLRFSLEILIGGRPLNATDKALGGDDGED